MYAPNNESVKGGIIKKAVVRPMYLNPITEKFGTSKVAIYKVITLDTQRKVPRVTKLKGKRSIFINGLSRASARVKAPAPKSNTFRSL